jgi:hypothetical protein
LRGRKGRAVQMTVSKEEEDARVASAVVCERAKLDSAEEGEQCGVRGAEGMVRRLATVFGDAERVAPDCSAAEATESVHTKRAIVETSGTQRGPRAHAAAVDVGMTFAQDGALGPAHERSERMGALASVRSEFMEALAQERRERIKAVAKVREQQNALEVCFRHLFRADEAVLHAGTKRSREGSPRQ